MKLTKKMLVAALVVGSLFAGSSALFAQNGGRAAQTSDTVIAHFQTALGEANKLTAAEIPKVKTVLDDMMKKQADLRADTTIAKADKATKRTAITKEATDAIKAIVTPAQFTVIEPLLQRGARRPAPAAGA